eukprot:7807929-Pyramimonas_sp.AAC.1
MPWVNLLTSDLGEVRELAALCSTLPPQRGHHESLVDVRQRLPGALGQCRRERAVSHHLLL